MNESLAKLITELASWNGRLSTVIDLALIDLKHNQLESATRLLVQALDAYNLYRDEQFSRITHNTQPQEVAREQDQHAG